MSGIRSLSSPAKKAVAVGEEQHGVGQRYEQLFTRVITTGTRSSEGGGGVRGFSKCRRCMGENGQERFTGAAPSPPKSPLSKQPTLKKQPTRSKQIEKLDLLNP